MKKTILTLVALMTMTMGHAENEETNAANSVSTYDMTVNYNSLARALELTSDQRDAVEEVHNEFVKAMQLAGQAGKDEREALVEKAVKRDVRYMRYILERDQYRKYLMLLNATLHNRGLR